MFYEKRKYTIHEYTTVLDDLSKLATDLTDYTWCGCQGFKIDNYYLLNDSTGPDGAQEYAVFKKIDNKLVQIESITFSWCNHHEALQYLSDILFGKYDDENYKSVDYNIIDNHKCFGCHLCM